MLLSLYRSGRLSQYLLWLASAAGVVGLLASRAVVALSPAVGVLAVLANPDWRRTLRGYLRNGAAMRAATLYGFLLLTGLYTTNWPEWQHQLYRLLPWLVVPLAFAGAVPLSGAQRRAVGSLFVLGTAAIGLATLWRFYQDPTAAAGINIGHNMQAVTRIFHIHFGIMLALAFFWGLALRREVGTAPWLRGVLLAASGVAALVIHLLAYRTGLLVLYAALLADALRLLWQRRLGLGLALGLGLLGLAWLAAHTLKPVQQRVGSSVWDLEQFQQGHDLNNYSLSRRLVAWQTATVLIRQQPWLGVGPADVDSAMLAQYAWHDYGLRPANRVMVHNEYLYQALAGGAVGLGLWLAVLLWPLAQPKQRRNPYIWHFVAVLGTAMLVDAVLELQIGFNLFVFGYGFLVVAGERSGHRPSVPTDVAA